MTEGAEPRVRLADVVEHGADLPLAPRDDVMSASSACASECASLEKPEADKLLATIASK